MELYTNSIFKEKDVYKICARCGRRRNYTEAKECPQCRYGKPKKFRKKDEDKLSTF